MGRDRDEDVKGNGNRDENGGKSGGEREPGYLQSDSREGVEGARKGVTPTGTQQSRGKTWCPCESVASSGGQEAQGRNRWGRRRGEKSGKNP